MKSWPSFNLSKIAHLINQIDAELPEVWLNRLLDRLLLRNLVLRYRSRLVAENSKWEYENWLLKAILHHGRYFQICKKYKITFDLTIPDWCPWSFRRSSIFSPVFLRLLGDRWKLLRYLCLEKTYVSKINDSSLFSIVILFRSLLDLKVKTMSSKIRTMW